MESERLLFLTDVPGVLDRGRRVVRRMTAGTGEGTHQRGNGIRGYDSKDRCVSARFEQWEHIADNRRERAGRASAVPGGRSVWDTDWIGRCPAPLDSRVSGNDGVGGSLMTICD